MKLREHKNIKFIDDFPSELGIDSDSDTEKNIDVDNEDDEYDEDYIESNENIEYNEMEDEDINS